MGKLKVLDCTLRDGGYYTDWDFEESMVKETIAALEASGIDIVEIGYKSKEINKFYGLYKYCTEELLEFLHDYSKLEFAFMIDVKEFIKSDNSIDYVKLKNTIPNKSNSLFHWCRVASYYSTIKQSVEIVSLLRGLGYKIGFNLMGISLLTKEELNDALICVNDMEIEVFYFADSFGSFLPNDIEELITNIRKFYRGSLGIHTHDNQGLAFANTLVAIDQGVEFVDATITGMGRGAGNLKLEQLLSALYFKKGLKQYNPFSLLDIIEKHFIPLQKEYQWDWDFSYMLSGLENIHPSYCQKLKSTKQYTISQVANIINEIPTEYRKKYSKNQLNIAINQVINKHFDDGKDKKIELDIFKTTKIDEIIIVGAGSTIKKYNKAIRKFISQRNICVYECNDSKELYGIKRSIFVLNWVRLKEIILNKNYSYVDEIVTGVNEISSKYYISNLKYYPFIISNESDSNIIDGKISLPAFNVGMFAINIALLNNPKKIYLVGFDGYSDNREEHREMYNFLSFIDKRCHESEIELYSLTPTQYDIEVLSIFSLLDNN